MSALVAQVCSDRLLTSSDPVEAFLLDGECVRRWVQVRHVFKCLKSTICSWNIFGTIWKLKLCLNLDEPCGVCVPAAVMRMRNLGASRRVLVRWGRERCLAHPPYLALTLRPSLCSTMRAVQKLLAVSRSRLASWLSRGVASLGASGGAAGVAVCWCWVAAGMAGWL